MSPTMQFYLDNIHRFNRNVKKHLKNRLVSAWTSELYCAVRYGCSPDDYFRYQFYKKSNYERNSFITYKRSRQLIKIYNDPNFISYFSDKRLFNHHFSEYLKRDWISLESIQEEEFLAFVKKNKRVLLKPVAGGQGKGIQVLEWEDAQGKLNSFRDYIAEEVLVQHPKMSALHPNSVNTIRILTFKGEIVACALRVGNNNSFVDNLHSKGICGHVDIETGIVDYPCVDNELNAYWKHPTTGETLIGFQIPLWDLVKEEVQKVAKEIPEVQYVGWDIAILPETIAIIEGNHDPGHDVVQMISQQGIYNVISNLIDA